MCALGAMVAILGACTAPPPQPTPSASTPRPSRSATPSPTPEATPTPTTDPGGDAGAGPGAGGGTGGGGGSSYPWHHDIPSTTFWVGEIFDPGASDGSQEISTYDSDWLSSYGGCDGVVAGGGCRTEARTAANDYFPSSMTPRENPFYLDLPYDDVNDATGFAQRDAVIPWASQQPYAAHRGDQGFSYLKNRWVQLVREGRTCYGQIQDAGPGQYHDAAYAFGGDDARPANTRYGGAGLDVSPALTGCLGYPELDGDSARVDWRFVEASEVPAGPWTRIITTSGVR
ncbi:hypothetical protein [Protaetiibacter mangrovi]|uniref:Secreted protein n=1 Tax=Protaetiibacter mangrovi TaxID=2970926 RepID=A0ABT1ZHJ3_9MICO|nr:hypothetical protein [Protaetiibacter mangrovi]MCS0500181.1 hypothetical protein [Protaetiibacter mangrovi]TPX05547.1 hypothetical protein FJ656_05940 [Schumannella luteola]